MLSAIATDFFHSMMLVLFFAYVALCYIVIFFFSLRRIEIRTLLVAMAVVCVSIATFQTHWPLRLRFQLSKPVLQQAIARSQSGESLQAPGWYGLFRPNKIKVFGRQESGAVAFNGSWFAGNFDGVVFAPNQLPRKLNCDSFIPLDEHWYFIHGA